MAEPQRRLYQAAYRTDKDEQTTQSKEPTSLDEGDSNTSQDGPASTPEDKSWKQRYGDLRTHSNSLTEKVRSLELQLQASAKQEIKIPSTQQELQHFSAQYPDVYRHIESIVLGKIMQERDSITQETKRYENDLETVKRELGHKKITQAHPDFNELNLSQKFHDWAAVQPKQIQDWLYETSDPELCIKAIDLFKAETAYKAPKQSRSQGADTLVNSKSTVSLVDEGGKRIWKGSEIAKLHPKRYEELEAEIESARRDGRIDPTS